MKPPSRVDYIANEQNEGNILLQKPKYIKDASNRPNLTDIVNTSLDYNKNTIIIHKQKPYNTCVIDHTQRSRNNSMTVLNRPIPFFCVLIVGGDQEFIYKTFIL